MTGSAAIATLLCALCIGFGAKVVQTGLHDRRRGRPEAEDWIVAGAYLLTVPSAILLAMVLS
jgi:hypothetical protein